jgi:hypothetical protein
MVNEVNAQISFKPPDHPRTSGHIFVDRHGSREKAFARRKRKKCFPSLDVFRNPHRPYSSKRLFVVLTIDFRRMCC